MPPATYRPYSTMRIGLPRIAADHVVASVTVALDGYAALILIQHPVGESSSQS